MSNPLAPFLIRIFGKDNTIVGAGFLVWEGVALTCAHVVAEALGIDTHAPDKPTGELKFDFPLLAPGKKLAAKVSHWFPLRSADQEQPAGDEDVALLQVLDDLPPQAARAPLAKAETAVGTAFQTFGFSAGHDRGVPADGCTKGAISGGCVVIEDTKNFGYFVAPGFSGAPVWSNNAVIGMIVSADKSQRAAYLIPSSLLWKDVVEPSFQAQPNKRYKEILRYLPYLCDRSKQEEELRDALRLHRRHQPRRPLLCVIHGDEFECHDKFIERLKDDLLPTLLPFNDALEEYLWHEPPPLHSTANQFWRSFGERFLSPSLESVAECRERIYQTLRISPNPLFVNLGWLTENCVRGGETFFSSFLQFWEDWPDLPPNRLVICGVSLQYQRSMEVASRLTFWRKSPNQSLRKQIDELKAKASDKLSVVVLSELQAISRSEAEEWTKHPKVRSSCSIPKEEITKLYRHNQDRPIAMEDLAPKLQQLLSGQPIAKPLLERNY